MEPEEITPKENEQSKLSKADLLMLSVPEDIMAEAIRAVKANRERNKKIEEEKKNNPQ